MALVAESAGVYVQENDQSQYSQALAAIVAGFVGTASWGPIDKATLVTGGKSLFDTFGPKRGASSYSPVLDSYPDQPMVYAIDRWLRRASRAWVVRVADSATLATATARIPGQATDHGPPGVNTTVPFITDPDTAPTVDNHEVTGGTLPDGQYNAVYTWVTASGETLPSDPQGSALDTGAESDVNTFDVTIPAAPTGITQANVYISYNASAPPAEGTEKYHSTVTVSGSPTVTTITSPTQDISSDVYLATARHPGTFGNQIELAVGNGSNWRLDAPTSKLTVFIRSANVGSTPLEREELFDALVADLNDTNNGVITRLGASKSAFVTLSLITHPDTKTSTVANPTAAPTVTPGTNGSLAAGTYRAGYSWLDADGESLAMIQATQATISAGNDGAGSLSFSTEVAPVGATHARVYVTQPGGDAADAQLVQEVPVVTAAAKAIVITRTADKQEMARSTTTAPHIVLSGGNDGIPASTNPNPYIGTAETSVSAATGLQIFRNREEYRIRLLAVPGVSHKAVVAEVPDVCKVGREGDSVAVIDPPPALSVQEAIEWHNGRYGTVTAPEVPITSERAALYYPWQQVQDAGNQQQLYLPPSAFATEVIAYTAFNSKAWFAPAGLQRGRLSGVLRPQIRLSRGDMDALYGAGNVINPIPSFFDQGPVIWGQRTAQRTASALDRLNVVFLLIIIREFVERDLKFLVFQPNDSQMWRRAVNTVKPALRGIQAERGLKNFEVIMNARNNPPEVVERNEARMDIFLIPVKAAEVIRVTINTLRQDAQFEFTETVLSSGAQNEGL